MRILGFVIISLCFVLMSSGQVNIKDSISADLKAKPEPFFSFHNRNTFIQSNRTRLFGLVGGAEFNDRLKLFTGIYGYGNADRTLLISSDISPDSLIRTINTSNFSIGIEYKFQTFDRLSLALPIQVGIGNTEYSYSELRTGLQLVRRDFLFIPLESGVNAYFAILPWMGLKAGVGYRLVIGKEDAFILSSPYYNLGVYLSVRDLYNIFSEGK